MSLGKQLTEARRSLKLTTSEVAAATRVKIQIIEGLEQDDFSKIAAPIYGKGFIRLYAEHVRIDPAPLIAEYMRAVGLPESPPLDLGTEASTPPPKRTPPRVQKPEKKAEPAEPEKTESEFDLFNAPAELTENTSAQDETKDVVAMKPEASETGDASAAQSPPGRRPQQPAEKQAPQDVALPKPGSRLRSPGRSHEQDEGRITAAEGIKSAGTQLVSSIAKVYRATMEKAGGLNMGKDPWKLIPVTIGLVLVIVFVISGLSRCARDPDHLTAGAEPSDPETLRIAVDLPEPYFE